jgi:AraC-like DNA-binding protein
MATAPDQRLAQERDRPPPAVSDDSRPQVSTVTEADDYSRSVGSVDIEVVRMGCGRASTEIRTVRREDHVATALRIGFPVLSRTTLADDLVGVMIVIEAPPGARVCGIEVTAEDVLVYGPGAEHLAIYPEGTRFAFTVISSEDLVEAAAELELDVEVEAGSVQCMVPSAASRLVGQALATADGDPAALAVATTVVEPRMLDALSHTLAGDVDRSVPTVRRIDDRKIVMACIEYAESAQRIPTLQELCEAVFVSERRLRKAFTATQDMPPHQFFLAWGLDLARRRLVRADSSTDHVSVVAASSGFTHLGRFALYYRRQFGESPSATLRWTASAEGLR